jgi:tetratricopeptide (TPR) repeat protein
MKQMITRVLIGILVFSANTWAQTPDIHYRQGVRELEAGRVATAAEEFSRARALNARFAPAYVGLARVELERWNYSGALALLKEAQRYDKKLVDVYAIRSQVYSREGQKNWEKKALAELKRGEKLDPRDDRIPYCRGIVYGKAGRFAEAAQSFGASVAMKGPLAEKAAREQQHVQQVVRAQAEAEHAGVDIALIPVVTRADLALLLLDEFDVKTWLGDRRPVVQDLSFREHLPVALAQKHETLMPQDIAAHPKRNAILDVLRLNIPGLELYPDGRFGAESPVTRAEFAQVMQGLLALGNRESDLATRYFGEASRFGDLRSDHFAYNAAVITIQRGILVARKDGSFGPDEPVSGAEAILGIKVALGL